MKKLTFNIFFLYFILISFCLGEVYNDIIIKGNKRISKSTIIVLGNINLNQNLDKNDLNNIVKSLYDTNFFKEISFETANNNLIINVIENPIISNIDINGIKNNSLLELITKNMSLKERMSFVDYVYSKDVDIIKNILFSNGYYFSKIQSKYNLNEKLNSVDITIDILLGEKAKINRISFLGDKKLKDKELLSVITSEEHRFWKFLSNRVYLNKERLNLDTRLLTNYYKNLGYYNVVVNNIFAEIDNKNDFSLTFNIESGQKFYFDKFVLNLPDDYNERDFSKINQIFEKINNDVYSVDKINDILEKIENIAAQKQYEFITADVNEEIVDNKISFTFNLKNSENLYVERINILGNFNTYEEVIRNRLLVDEGDPLNDILYNKSLDNIRSTGFFKSVDSQIRDGDTPSLKILEIEVEEQPTGEISLGAGYGTSGSTIGGGITEKNFLGKGINLKTNLELSESTIKGEFTYIKPYFNNSENTLKTSIKSLTNDFLTDYGYKVSTIGLSVGTDFEQLENLILAPELEITFDDLETNNIASSNLKKQQGSYEDIYFNYSLNYDARNSKFKTTEGYNLSYFQNLPIVSGNNEISNTFIFNQYIPLNLSKSTIGKGSLYFKTVNSIDESDVRISKRSQIPYSRLRGFERGKIGPKDNNDYIGGNYAAAINLSTNLPFLFPTLENLEFNYFFDAANVWGVDYDSTIDDSNFIRSSTGLGLNFLTPIGPLSFSLTQPITKKSSDKTESFRFNLGTTF